ncbi:MarR family transcriptional regulator [Methylophaga sp. OBS3]|nr:MarR family transcriptional regulator [Methylophaga sp. OBS3]
MGRTMLQLKDLPDKEIIRRFAERYPQANVDAVLSFLKVLQVGTDLSLALNQYLAEFDLLQGRWWVLILLMREEDKRATPSTLAEKAGVSRATMTGLLDGLLKERLISREHALVDRRQIEIKLTQAGQDKLDEVMPGYYERVSKLMATIDSDLNQQMIEALTILHNHRQLFFN